MQNRRSERGSLSEHRGGNLGECQRPATGKVSTISSEYDARDEAAKAEIAKHHQTPFDTELKKAKMDDRRVQHNYLK